MKNKNTQEVTKKADESDLYTCFEKEFGRPLSPFECESLAMWMDDDHHDPIIIKAALRESVMSGKLNFRYIDRILFEWKKNGIKTIEQAKNHGRKFRQKQTPNRPSTRFKAINKFGAFTIGSSNKINKTRGEFLSFVSHLYTN